MSKIALGLLLCSVVIAGGLLFWRNAPEPAPYEPNIRWQEPAPVCPWRDPSTDIKQWFPQAADHKEEICVLSHLRAELEKALGHPPEPSDLAPTLFKIVGTNGNQVGTVMTRRVKGEHGAIEIAVPFDHNGKIFGLKVQRHREPEKIGDQLIDLHTQEQLIRADGSPVPWPQEFVATGQAIEGAINQLRVIYSACQKREEGSKTRHH